MAKQVGNAATTVRFTPEDRKIMDKLESRLGLGTAAVLRLAIRKLAQVEKV